MLPFILGTILVLYSSLGMVFETWYPNDEEAERTLCRWFLCDSTPLLTRARQRLWEPRDEGPSEAVADFRGALQRNAHDPYRWLDLGRALLLTGHQKTARDCFRQVAVLAPYRPALLLRVANFHFQLGETAQALPITARILKAIPDYDSVIFSQYTRLVDRLDDILRDGLPAEPRPARSWLRFLIRERRLSDARRTWDWLGARQLADDASAGEYIQLLLDQHQFEEAAASWAGYLGRSSGDYRRSNEIFNGDFEREPTGCPLDWRLSNTEGVEVGRESASSASGRWSLRLRFPGTDNLNYQGVSQFAVVDPGPYRFQAFVRTEEISTDQGIRFRLFDAEAPARFNLETESLTGTNDWKKVEKSFRVPEETKLVRLLLIRQPSLKFDNKIQGTAWIDSVRLERGSHPD